MTYNFDPERWYKNEYSVLEALHSMGDLTYDEFKKACSDLLDRYEKMISRLDGTFQIPK